MLFLLAIMAATVTLVVCTLNLEGVTVQTQQPLKGIDEVQSLTIDVCFFFL